MFTKDHFYHGYPEGPDPQELADHANEKIQPLLKHIQQLKNALQAVIGNFDLAISGIDLTEKMINRRIWTDEEEPSEYNRGQSEFATLLKNKLRDQLLGMSVQQVDEARKLSEND